jgi:hypothetical protein
MSWRSIHCSIKHHTVKTYGGVDVHLHALLTSALDGGEWFASRPGRSTPGERDPPLHYPLDRSGCASEVKRIPAPNPGLPIQSLITILTEINLKNKQNTHVYMYECVRACVRVINAYYNNCHNPSQFWCRLWARSSRRQDVSSWGYCEVIHRIKQTVWNQRKEELQCLPERIGC